jgi:hypothetical protein
VDRPVIRYRHHTKQWIALMMTADETEGIARLLPFYVNGTLSAAECARVDAAVAASHELRDELAAIGNLAQMMKSGGKEIMQGEDRGAARLAAAMGQLEDKQPHSAPQTAVSGPPPSQAMGGFLSFLNPKRWHPAVSLGLAVAFVAQGAAISGLSEGKQESQAQIASLQKRVGDLEFELASGPGEQKAGNIIIEVKPDAAWSAVESLLGQEGLSIVGGPSDGAITLSSEATGATLDAQIKRIRASSLIASVDKAA